MVNELLLVLMILNLVPGHLFLSPTPDAVSTHSSWCGFAKLVPKFLGSNGGLTTVTLNVDMAGEPTRVAFVVVSMRRQVKVLTPLHVGCIRLVSYLAAPLLFLSRRLQILSFHPIKIRGFSASNDLLLLLSDKIW